MQTKCIFSISLLLCLGACHKNNPEGGSQAEEYQVVTINSDWFEVGYLTPKTYIIEEPKSSQGNVSYLLLGDERAIMLDTGTGENQPENGWKIKPVVDELTDLPTTLLLSHFHFDHNQNIEEFDRVAFPEIPFLQQEVSADGIYHFTDHDLFLGSHPEQVHIEEWLPLGEDIDLGNRIVQLVNIPGHTRESVAIIDKTNKLAFLGDFLYNGALFVFDANDLPIYSQSVDQLVSILDSGYRLFGAHGQPEVAFANLQKLKGFIACVTGSTCIGTQTSVFGYPVLYYNYQGMEMVVFEP